MGPGAAPAWQHDAREGAGRHDHVLRQRRHTEGSSPVAGDRGAAGHGTQNGDAGLELHARKPATGRQPGRLPAAHRGRLDGRLGSGTVLLGVQRFGPTAVRCAPADAYQSYTVLKAPWSAAPAERPRIAVRAGAHGGIVAYASWNGATGVAQWRLLAGASQRSLSPVATVPRRAFETRIAIMAAPRYAAAQALGEQGQVLGTSAVTRG